MSVCVAVTDNTEGQAALVTAASEAAHLNVSLVAVNLISSDLDTSALKAAEVAEASRRTAALQAY